MAEPTFVLDLDANPHPDLLALAIEARRRASLSDTNHAAAAYALGILHACAAATGTTVDEVTKWISHHETKTHPWPPARSRLTAGSFPRPK